MILIGLIFYWAASLGQEIYQWVDQKGTVHFTDDLNLVPERYRNQVREKKYLTEPSPPLSPQITPDELIEKNPEPPTERKDLIGRGEDWWKAKAKEWNEKLLNAQKNYETANTEYKKKEKELEESKFKPKSLKRKLKSEVKALEEKANNWKKQIEDAKHMLDKALPKEAEEMNADPDWIKVE